MAMVIMILGFLSIMAGIFALSWETREPEYWQMRHRAHRGGI